MRSVKTNKELLLERVTEPRRYAPGTRLGGHSEKEWIYKGENAYGKNNFICKRKREHIP